MMFGKKKLPVLTATFCCRMEKIRQALEVLTGKQIQFAELDLNTGQGAVLIARERQGLSVSWSGMLEFKLGNSPDWYLARRFNESHEICVISTSNPLKRHDHSMWLVGSSAADRREEPLYPRQVEYAAQQLGMPVEEYLKS